LLLRQLGCAHIERQTGVSSRPIFGRLRLPMQAPEESARERGPEEGKSRTQAWEVALSLWNDCRAVDFAVERSKRLAEEQEIGRGLRALGECNDAKLEISHRVSVLPELRYLAPFVEVFGHKDMAIIAMDAIT